MLMQSRKIPLPPIAAAAREKSSLIQFVRMYVLPGVRGPMPFRANDDLDDFSPDLRFGGTFQAKACFCAAGHGEGIGAVKGNY